MPYRARRWPTSGFILGHVVPLATVAATERFAEATPDLESGSDPHRGGKGSATR